MCLSSLAYSSPYMHRCFGTGFSIWTEYITLESCLSITSSPILFHQWHQYLWLTVVFLVYYFPLTSWQYREFLIVHVFVVVICWSKIYMYSNYILDNALLLRLYYFGCIFIVTVQAFVYNTKNIWVWWLLFGRPDTLIQQVYVETYESNAAQKIFVSFDMSLKIFE